MNRVAVMTLMFSFALTVPLWAQQQPTPEEIEKAFIELGTPGEEHERFKKMVGDWKAVCTMYEGNPDQPQVSEATATFRLLMGGRYLQQRFSGEFGGQRFTGMGISAFDRAQKKYTGVWIDNMSTGIMHTTGEYDAAQKTLSEIGEFHGPTGVMKMKMVTREKNADAFTFTMYMLLPDGTERKQMEIEYTRVAAAE